MTSLWMTSYATAMWFLLLNMMIYFSFKILLVTVFIAFIYLFLFPIFPSIFIVYLWMCHSICGIDVCLYFWIKIHLKYSSFTACCMKLFLHVKKYCAWFSKIKTKNSTINTVNKKNNFCTFYWHMRSIKFENLQYMARFTFLSLLKY